MSASLPELMGTAEVAAFLGVTGSRIRQMRRDVPAFPAAAYELSCGLIWLADDVRAFASGYQVRSKGGRPRKAAPQ